MSEAQSQSAVSGLQLEGNDLEALLKKEFKPKTSNAKEAIEVAVKTLAAQALEGVSLISDDAVKSIEAIIAAIDQKLSQQINEILHHADFQALEGSWRGLSHLVNNTETDQKLKIRVMNISKTELADTLEDFEGQMWDQSPIFKKTYTDEYSMFGGEPFGERILMWWNFVGRTHEEVARARAQWQASIDGDPVGVDRFGRVTGYDGAPLPAPALPNVRLRPRER